MVALSGASFNAGPSELVDNDLPKSALDDCNGTDATVDSDDDNMDVSPSTSDDGFDGFLQLVGGEETATSSPTAVVGDEVGDAAVPVSPTTVISDDEEDDGVQKNHFDKRNIKDSIQVQRCHKANDDEVHESNPHLQDYLVPHHSFHVENIVEEEPEETSSDPVTKEEKPLHGILVPEAEVSPASEPSEEKSKRKVHFGTVVVRDYEMIMGDHPCCSYGPPLTIDWDYLEYEPLKVDDYEFHHPPRRCLREMGLNYYQRKNVLSLAGYTDDDFKLATKKLNRDKSIRSLNRMVATSTPLLMAETTRESLFRKVKRVMKEDHWKVEKSLFKKKVQDPQCQ